MLNQKQFMGNQDFPTIMFRPRMSSFRPFGPLLSHSLDFFFGEGPFGIPGCRRLTWRKRRRLLRKTFSKGLSYAFGARAPVPPYHGTSQTSLLDTLPCRCCMLVRAHPVSK